MVMHTTDSMVLNVSWWWFSKISGHSLNMSKWLWILGNHHWLTFRTIESVICITMLCYWLQLIDMITLKFTNTNSVQFKAVENFFDPSQIECTLQWNTLYEGFEMDYSPKKESLTEMTICVMRHSEIFLLVYMTCYLDLGTFLWSYLSAEINWVTSRHVDQILSPQTWTRSHFSAFIITLDALSGERKPQKSVNFAFSNLP